MLTKILSEAAESLNTLNFYTISLNEAMYNHEASIADKFPAIVLFNDIQTTDTINNSTYFQDTQFVTRWLFADKIEILDDFGSNILEVQERMRALAKQYIRNIVLNKDFQELNTSGQTYSFDSVSFAHEFDSDLAGVFVNFTFSLRLPVDYCKYEC